MNYILALDQGTTSSRAVLVSQSGKIEAEAQKEFRQIFPSSGWVEHDPKDIWSSQAAVIAELLAHKSISAEQIKAIGITNQRETTIVWSRKTGQAICNAIVWQDRRTTKFCQKLKEQGHEPMIQKKTGLIIDPYFSGTKIHWILNNVPKAQDMADRGDLCFGTVDSWLIWKLTEGKTHITDVTNASRTMLFNIHTLEWDQELLDLLHIPRSLLPEVRTSSEVYAEAHLPAFPKPIPIAGIAGDQQAALFGQICTQPGMAKATYGTGSFILMNTGTRPVISQNKLLTTIASKIGDRTEYAMEGSVFIAGAIIQWLRDELKIIPTSDAVEPLARTVTNTGGVYFVPALTGLGAPHWNPETRGTIFGITRGTTKAHIARAALEGIAFQVNDVLHAMEKDSGIAISELRVDGGAVKDKLLMQFQADLLNVPIIRPKITELTALGAAFLAGLATGFWKNQKEIAALWTFDHKFEPAMTREKASFLKEKWNKALECAKQWKGITDE